MKALGSIMDGFKTTPSKMYVTPTNLPLALPAGTRDRD
jgi:hypothetical protein